MPSSRVAAGMKAGDEQETSVISQIDEAIRKSVEQETPSLSGDDGTDLRIGSNPGQVLEDDCTKFVT